MGWRDRDYNQDRFGGGQMHPLLRLLFGSVSLGHWFGIHVRVHASLIILIGLSLLFAGAKGGPGVQNALTAGVVLFAIVLLHEFGHCIGAKMVRGHADEILLWPLGGLASVSTPRRPWPSFVATACGPLVNVLICGICALILEISYDFHFRLPLNPMYPFATGEMLARSVSFDQVTGAVRFHWDWTYYVWWVYATSWSLLVFNLLPIFPMDGGRILQEILWPIVGYVRSMKFACITGIVGGVLLGMVGMANWNFLLVFVALSGVSTCYQTLLLVKAGMLEEETGPDYAASLWDEPPRRKKIKKGWFHSARKKAQREAAEQARIDAILAKVSEKGLHSLTWWEKRTLKKATERQRQRDLAERL